MKSRIKNWYKVKNNAHIPSIGKNEEQPEYSRATGGNAEEGAHFGKHLAFS